MRTRLYPGMFTLNTPLLDERSWKVGKRLVIQHGSDEAAEKWLATPNTHPYFGGEKPADYFRKQGEGAFTDRTCNVLVDAFRTGIVRKPESEEEGALSV